MVLGAPGPPIFVLDLNSLVGKAENFWDKGTIRVCGDLKMALLMFYWLAVAALFFDRSFSSLRLNRLRGVVLTFISDCVVSADSSTSTMCAAASAARAILP